MRWLAAVLVIVGCANADRAENGDAGGTYDAGEIGTGRTIERACDEQVAARCREFEKCATWREKWEFASEADCRTLGRQRCIDRARLPGVVKPVRWIDYCTSMIELASCGDLKRLCPASRDFAGTLPDAAKCVADHQCAGGFCSGTHVPIVAICGTCMLLPVVGDACATDDDCNGGGWVSLICGASKRCEQRPPQLTCSALEPCSPVFECVDGKCQQGSLPEGSACSPTAGCAPGLGCGPGDVCVPAQPLLVGPGEPCTGDSPPTGEPARYCRGENTCERGVCVPITYASCGFSMLSCGWGAVCRTETNTCEPLATICP